MLRCLVNTLRLAKTVYRYNDFVKQQASISFGVHVGVFESMRAAYRLCTEGHADDAFDVIIRTRPDANLAVRAVQKAVTDFKYQIATGQENVVAGCVRQRSIRGGDFSDVAFVGSRPFWELFASTFDVYSQYDNMYSRPCVKFQKGQAEDMTGKGNSCCAREDCASLFGELKRPCKYNTAPPCSFTPESFFRTWMNENRVGVTSMPYGSVSLIRDRGQIAPVCTP